jgi:hypothetical protein
VYQTLYFRISVCGYVPDRQAAVRCAAFMTPRYPTPPNTTASTNMDQAPTVGVGIADAVGITRFEVLEGAPVPAAFVARIVQVYDVPLGSRLTVIGLDAPVGLKLPGLQVAV